MTRLFTSARNSAFPRLADADAAQVRHDAFVKQNVREFLHNFLKAYRAEIEKRRACEADPLPITTAPGFDGRKFPGGRDAD